MSRRITAVLSGGGVKAAAHLGAIRALREAGLRPTRYVATSMGAVLAALLAEGREPEAVFQRVRRVRRRDVARLRAAGLVQGLWTSSLMHPEPLQRTIASLVTATTFAELAVPLTITAADLDTSEVVVFGEGGEEVPLHERPPRLVRVAALVPTRGRQRAPAGRRGTPRRAAASGRGAIRIGPRGGHGRGAGDGRGAREPAGWHRPRSCAPSPR